MSNDNDPLLTTSEVAAELRIKRTAMYALLRSGKLPYLDLGYNTKRIRRSDLDAYLAECKRAAN